MAVLKIIIAVILLVIITISANITDGPTVITTTGRVAGSLTKSFEGRNAIAFEGIPYAKPPVGDLRFKDPQPMEPWSHLLVANETHQCWWDRAIDADGSEDCLYLNVYVPRIKVTQQDNFDVVVNIHAGGFTDGSPSRNSRPEYLLDRDVIFVTFSYRLGVFGFLSTGNSICPGNYGLKDQVMALKWVQNNIQYFGGNPNSVTIVGIEAGAASVHYHYLSPLSKGLFHRGLSQSGTALNPWALIKNPLKKFTDYASSQNCKFRTVALNFECLKNARLPPRYFIFGKYPYNIFGPVIENGKNAFLPDHPYKILLDGKINHLPWILSHVQDEGNHALCYTLSTTPYTINFNYMCDKWIKNMPLLLHYNDTVDGSKLTSVNRILKETYLNARSISTMTIERLGNLITDRMFLIDADTAVRLHAKTSKLPVYYFSFEYKLVAELDTRGINRFRKTEWELDRIPGVIQGDDGRLLYKMDDDKMHLNETDIQMKNIYLDFLYEYARTGIPTFNNIEWTPVTFTELKYMHVGSPSHIKMYKMKQLGPKQFWNSLELKENEYLYNK